MRDTIRYFAVQHETRITYKLRLLLSIFTALFVNNNGTALRGHNKYQARAHSSYYPVHLKRNHQKILKKPSLATQRKHPPSPVDVFHPGNFCFHQCLQPIHWQGNSHHHSTPGDEAHRMHSPLLNINSERRTVLVSGNMDCWQYVSW